MSTKSVNRNLTTEVFEGSIRVNGFVRDYNPYFNRIGTNNGINLSVKGTPGYDGPDGNYHNRVCSEDNILCNCVGFAWGAYNETWNKGVEGTSPTHFAHCRGNANRILENAKSNPELAPYILGPDAEPPIGGLIFWGGSANHVAYIARVEDTRIYVIESGWNFPKWTVRNYANTGWCNNEGWVPRNGTWGNRNGVMQGFLANPGANKKPTPDDNPATITSITQTSQTNISVIGDSNGVEDITVGSRVYFKWDSSNVTDTDYSGFIDASTHFVLDIEKPHESTSVAVCAYQRNTTGLVVRGILSVAQLSASIPCIYVSTGDKRRQGIPYIFTQGQWKKGVPLLYTKNNWHTIYNDKE